MKKLKFWQIALILGFLIFLMSLLTELGNSDSNVQKYETEKLESLLEQEDPIAAKILLDSLKTTPGFPDSLLKKFETDLVVLQDKINQKEIAKKRLSELRPIEDKFQGCTFYFDKGSPKFDNQNGIFLYFAINKDGKAENLRLKIQYFANDWLFVQKVVFLIDGETFEYAPGTWKRDNNTDIWEYNDSRVDAYSAQIITKLVNSKDAQMRFEGQQYYKDKQITKSQILAMRRVLEIYQSISGAIY